MIFCKKHGITAYAQSDIGLIRSNNEDNYLLNDCINRTGANTSQAKLSKKFLWKKWVCAAVFDGMGGAEQGEVASLIAAKELQDVYMRLENNTQDDEVDEEIRKMFQNANRKIIEHSRASVCGTTGTVWISDGKRFKLFHSGDSRAYLFRESVLYRLTKDQTMAQLKVDAGFYREDTEASEIERNQLVEYIGCDNTFEGFKPLESEWIDFLKEDKILLCSDGMYDMCSDFRIKTKMEQLHTAQEITNGLIKEALEQGGKDNITCITIMP